MVHTPLWRIQTCGPSCETEYQEKPTYASEPSGEGEETGTEILEIFIFLKKMCLRLYEELWLRGNLRYN
jgi:hypothetical protein